MTYDRGVADVVRVRGSLGQSELVQRYVAHDLFIFPTWSGKPFGFAPLEAAACVPLVTADCGFAEWWSRACTVSRRVGRRRRLRIALERASSAKLTSPP
jgi:hypothetical protein